MANESCLKTPVRVPLEQKADNMVKSPSDTTIYVPALVRRNDGQNTSAVNNLLLNNISEFIGSAHSQVEEQERRNMQSPQLGTSRQTANVRSAIKVIGKEDAQRRTDEAIIEGEKFEATVAIKTGESSHNILNVPPSQAINQQFKFREITKESLMRWGKA